MNETDYSLVGQVEEEISYKDLESLFDPRGMAHWCHNKGTTLRSFSDAYQSKSPPYWCKLYE